LSAGGIKKKVRWRKKKKKMDYGQGEIELIKIEFSFSELTTRQPRDEPKKTFFI
jgi:hypothetical protein